MLRTFIGSLTIFLTVLQLSANAFCLGTITTPEGDPNSFYNLAVNDSPNFVKQQMNATCITALKSRNGRPIHSEKLAKYLVKIKDVPYQQVSDGLFFHYTTAKLAFESAKSGRLDEIFSYLRRPDGKDAFLYVASDPDSSRHFGDLQVRLQINPEAMIFFPMPHEAFLSQSQKRDPKELKITGGTNGPTLQMHLNVMHEIENDIVVNDPTLSACAGVQLGEMKVSTLLLTLALEAEHVPLIAYFGTGMGWFQILGEWGVNSVVTSDALPPLSSEQARQRASLLRRQLESSSTK